MREEKYQLGNRFFPDISLNYQTPISNNYLKQNLPLNLSFYPKLEYKMPEPSLPKMKSIRDIGMEMIQQPQKKSSTGQAITSAGISALGSALTNQFTDNLFGDSELGQVMGNVFSQGVSSATDTMANNIIKGTTLTNGLGKNVGNSIAGAGVGMASNYIGQGINSALGDSKLSRGIGQGVATGLGTVGGQMISNAIAGNGLKATFAGTGLFSDMSKMGNAINPYALGASVVGSALGAAMGPSKEYGGKYGGITRGLDTAYDLATVGVNFIPGIGQGISGVMALNKGLSNIFGSTDGMTVQDAILGSAFMPAPIKWINMWGSSKTGTFNNQSWQNTEKTNSFMGDAFGNLNDRFNQAREEAGKTYGTFSQGAKRDAQRNIDFANYAWNKVLNMADQNILQNIKSYDMSSINNQRYAQMIQGGFKPLAIGKQGMKILNNATNHNIGMRLLSGAALIDNKQMILSAQGGTKVTRPPRMRAHRKGDESRGLTPEEQEWWQQYEKEQKRQQEENTARKIKEKEEAAYKFNKQVNTVMGAMTQQANETPFTGQEYQQAAENQRQEKVEKFHEAEKIGEAAMMADLAVSAVPLLQRGFRWAFNKAGQLIKVPIQKTIQLKSGITKNIQDNGKIRLSLPSHTDNKPRQFVLEPAPTGDNKYYVHMRMWDDVENKIPASNVTNEEKQQLFDALYDELPEGAEILFPKSGPGFYGTRGTVAGLQRLARDPRFTPGTKGTLQYLDKDGKTIRTYEGTSFIKTENGWQGNRYVQDQTTLEGIQNFIDNDIIPRIQAQGHNVSSYTPTFRQFSPKTDAFDEAMSKANSGSGAWFTPASNDITIRGPLEKQDFGLTIHEAGGHGLRYNMQPDYVPTKREYLNEYIITGGKDMSDETANALLKVHTGDQIYNVIEAQKLRESYPWIKTYFERNPVKKSGDVVLRESGSINTQFRSHYSNNGKIVGKKLDEVIDKASPGVVLRDLIEQPYTSSIIDDITKITGKDSDALQFYGPEMLEKLVNSYPKLQEIVSKVKDTMKTVGNYGIPITIGGSTAATLYNTNK